MKFFCLLFTLIFTSSFAYSQEWIELGNIPFKVHHTNGFGFGDKAYIIEGTNQVISGPNTLWEYEPFDDSWTELGDFPGTPRGFAIGDPYEGKYYFGFGVSGTGSRLKDLWVFDPVDTSWTELPSCPCPGRTHPALSAHNGKVFVGAGGGAAGDLDDWWEYDMETQEWTEKTNMPGGLRHHPFFFAIGDNIFVGGGHRTNWWRWNMIDENWTEINDYPAGRVAGTQFEYNGRGYLLGGDDRFHNHIAQAQSFMRYNEDEDDWEELDPFPDGGRWACSSFIIDGEVYYFGGLSFNGGDDLKMWKYDLEALDNPSSVQENAWNINAVIHPNPAGIGQLLTIENADIANQNDLKMYDLQGKDQSQNIEFLNHKTIKILISGRFIVQFKTKEGHMVRKIVSID